jgi:hypothetical protein
MDIKEADSWFTKTFDLPVASSLTLEGGQKPTALLSAKIVGYQYRQTMSSPLEQFVLVDISGSHVSPGTVAFNRDDKRGGFTDQLELRIWFADDGAFFVTKSGPDTTSESGSASSSMSYTVDVGTFGKTATANAAWSITSGVSRSIPDFELISRTGATGDRELNHLYRMRLIGESKYSVPPDAVEFASSALGLVREPPPRAVGDLPIYSSALFRRPSAADGTRTLKISLRHRVMTIEKTFFPGPPPGLFPIYQPEKPDEKQLHVIPRWYGSVTAKIEPAIATHEWSFDIDLHDGDATVHA